MLQTKFCNLTKISNLHLLRAQILEFFEQIPNISFFAGINHFLNITLVEICKHIYTTLLVRSFVEISKKERKVISQPPLSAHINVLLGRDTVAEHNLGQKVCEISSDQK